MLRKGLLCIAVVLAMSASATAQNLLETGFEPPVYTGNSTVDGVDGWYLLGGEPGQVVVQSTYVHSGSQALGIQQPAGRKVSVALLHDFAAWSEGVLTVEFWAMPGDNVDATGSWIAVEEDGNTAKRSALFGFRSGVFAYNSGAGWVNSTVAYNVGQWYKLTGVLDYDARTWSFYVDDQLMSGNMNFWHASHTTANAIRFYKGGSNVGLVVDDVLITPEPTSVMALLIGFGGVAGFVRRKKQ